MKNYLLDTYVISEWTKPRPDSGLVRWLDDIDEDRTFLSVLSIGEVRKGIERMGSGPRKDRLLRWFTEELPDRFGGRLLSVDLAVANAWGRIAARTRADGVTIPDADALIAATAVSHRLEVVTRNVAHFAPTGVTVCNPWSA